jgi:hypothetical protein
MEMAHTLGFPNNEPVVTLLRLDCMLRDEHWVYNNNDLKELEEFDMYVFNALRNRSDRSTRYESLKVGV